MTATAALSDHVITLIRSVDPTFGCHSQQKQDYYQSFQV